MSNGKSPHTAGTPRSTISHAAVRPRSELTLDHVAYAQPITADSALPSAGVAAPMSATALAMNHANSTCGRTNRNPSTLYLTIPPLTLHLTSALSLRGHGSNAKMRFQSFFMLMTTQPHCFASSYSACVKVPTLVSGSPWAGP
jgi:hypothetical protein